MYLYKEGKKSSFFTSNIGVRQGENLSPFLFALFINDIEEFFLLKEGKHLSFDCPEKANFMKLLIILYADDTVILADSAESLQEALDILATYCDKYQLSVNSGKTKICILRKATPN